MSKKYNFYYKLLRPLVVVFLIIRFGYKYKKAENLPEKYIVLSNHVSDYDPLLVGASFSRQMYFVASEHIARWGLVSKLLKYFFAPILRKKGASASSAVIEIMRRSKNGDNVCVFAEGVRTWDGVTCPITYSTAKMVKKLGCGLVTYKITGGYFVSPMWGGASVRRGKISGSPVNVYTAEQLSAMSNDEVYEAIVNDLYEDAYERQLSERNKYKGKRLAERLENMLYICPDCGEYDSFSSRDDTVSCRKCGFSFKFNEYAMLEGAPFVTLKEFHDWQKKKTFKDVVGKKSYCASNAVLMSVNNHENTLIAEGKLELSVSHLRCGDREFLMSDITEMAMHGQRAIVFTANKEYYELLPSSGFNVLKFLVFYNSYIESKSVCKES